MRKLLAFGRKQVPNLQVFSLNSVVEEACKMLPWVLGEDIEMRVNLGRNLGRVKADSGHIEQVLLNLAINARCDAAWRETRYRNPPFRRSR